MEADIPSAVLTKCQHVEREICGVRYVEVLRARSGLVLEENSGSVFAEELRSNYTSQCRDSQSRTTALTSRSSFDLWNTLHVIIPSGITSRKDKV